MAAPLAAALIAIAFGFASIALASGRRLRYIVLLSGVLLAAVALLGLMPELAQEIGWARTLLMAAAGYGFLAILDHRGYAVCPSCSHGEKFAGSLVLATALHAFVDGWGVAAARNQGAVASAITVAILLHKAPEGVALGAMLRASTPGPKVAALLCAVAELPTIVGGAVGIWATPPVWADYMLALVSGTFLFLGLHAVLTTRAAGIRRAPTGSAGVNMVLSTRSRKPPCPGRMVPLSLTPALRLMADSARSPNWPATLAIRANAAAIQ